MTILTDRFVSLPVVSPQNFPAIAVLNPLAGPDKHLAYWFHAHLTPRFVEVLRAFSEFGSGEWIGCALFFLVLFFAWKRWWPWLFTLVVTVPAGMLLNEWVKVLVHRHRPFVAGPFVDWSGYSFASGHTIGATLLYGQLLLFIVPVIKGGYWRKAAIFMGMLLVGLVGFSRIALGAHYLTDVLGGIVFGIVWLALCLFVCRAIRWGRVFLPVSSDTPVEESVIAAPVQQLHDSGETPLVVAVPGAGVLASPALSCERVWTQ
jgi:membrane-associated phospholipid phosphatase